jgi:catechol 2,3-dioxygenase-like lactoylglutathione lyase family enzyme
VRAIHHTAIVAADVDESLRFWRDGLGLRELLDHSFTGDWPTLFDAESDVLRSVFLGDPDHANSGILELVHFDGVGLADPGSTTGPRRGFFLVSLERDVDATLAHMAGLGFVDDVRRISMPAPGGKTVAMAVLTDPDGVRVELIGAPS